MLCPLSFFVISFFVHASVRKLNFCTNCFSSSFHFKPLLEEALHSSGVLERRRRALSAYYLLSFSKNNSKYRTVKMLFLGPLQQMQFSAISGKDTWTTLISNKVKIPLMISKPQLSTVVNIEQFLGFHIISELLYKYAAML